MNVGTVLCQEEILIIGEGGVMLSFSAGDQLKALKALISFYPLSQSLFKYFYLSSKIRSQNPQLKSYSRAYSFYFYVMITEILLVVF